MMNLQTLNVTVDSNIKKVNKDGKLYHFTTKQSLDETKYHLDANRNDHIKISDIEYNNDNDNKANSNIRFKPNSDFMINSNSNSSSNSKHHINSNKTTTTTNTSTTSSNNKPAIPKSLSSFKENDNSNSNSMQMFDDYMNEINQKKKGQWIQSNNNNNNNDQPIKVAMNIIQSKYEKNLQVITTLHDEKAMMRQQLYDLQYENSILRKQAGIDDYDYYNDNDDDYYYYTRRSSMADEYDDEYDNAYSNDTSDAKKMTAMELALLLESDHSQQKVADGSRPKSTPTTSSRSGIKSNKSSPRLGMSKNLLAAQDKFIQRRRASDIADRKKQVNEAIADREYREKVHRASLAGKAPTGIFERQKAANDKFLSKQEKRDLEAKAKKEAEDRLKREQIEADEEYRNDPKNHFTWQEMCDIEDGKRRDRIERRKHELAAVSRAPKCASIENKKENTDSNSKEKKYEFIAEDPDLVAIRLQRERAEWEDHIAKAKKKAQKRIESERFDIIDPVTGLNKFTSGMESRQQEYLRRKNEKLEKDRIEKEIELEKQKRDDENRTLRLRESLPPPTKITKATEIYINETRRKIADQEVDNHNETNFQTTTNKNSYLNEVQEALELKAKDATAAFMEQSRIAMIKNKKNIKLAVKNRPTLLQRQEAQVRKEIAVDNAIAKINGIIKETMITEKAEAKIKANSNKKYNDSKYDSDDDYDEKDYK